MTELSKLKDTVTCTAAPPVVPSSGYEWRLWASWAIEALGLCSQEANLLRLLAGRAKAGGTVFLGVPLLARQMVLSESQVYRWLAALTDRGLLKTEQQGPGRVARRTLLAVPQQVQLSLFDDTAAPAVRPAESAAPAPPAAHPWPRVLASLPSHQPEPAVGGALKQQQQGSPAPAKPVLSPSLPAVLAILAQVPELVVEEYAVDTALRSWPAADHLQAAGRVVMLASEQGLEHMSASRQLWKALERQSIRSLPSSAPHGGRRRVAPPQPVPVSPAGRRWGPTENKFDRAAGLV